MRRRGYVFIVEVVAALRDRPQTTKDLHETLGADSVAPHVLGKMLRRLWDLRVLRVAEWRIVGPRCGYERVMAVGDEPDAPPPRRHLTRGNPSLFDGLPRGKGETKAMTDDFAALWHAMARQCSRKRLLEAGVCHSVTKRLLVALKTHGLVRTAAWERGQRAGLPTEIFQRGSEPDAPRPIPRPKSDPIYRRRRAARNRAARRMRNLAANASIFRIAQGG